MWRRATLSGCVVLCALTAAGAAAAGSGDDDKATASWIRNPWDRGGGGGRGKDDWRRPGTPPVFRDASRRSFAIPSGRCYTGLVIVPAKTTSVLRVTFNDGCTDFPVVVQGGQSFVIPFVKGWRPERCASLSAEVCDGEFEAWAIGENGPVALECGYH